MGLGNPEDVMMIEKIEIQNVKLFHTNKHTRSYSFEKMAIKIMVADLPDAAPGEKSASCNSPLLPFQRLA